MHNNTGLADHNTMATNAFVANSLIAQGVLGQSQQSQQQQQSQGPQQQQQQQLHSQMMGGPLNGPPPPVVSSQQGQPIMPMSSNNNNPVVPGNNNGGQQQQQQIPPQGTEGTQQFCLRWNSYPATVATQLAALRAAEDFVDVTLACDGRQLRAHKLVLSACSPYFMQLFKSTPCQHPVIFLKDVGFRQLVALLEFMYAGEVNVSQVELPALLRTAEALQVRGLADTTANNNNNLPQCPQPPTQQNKPAVPVPQSAPFYGQIISQSVMNPNSSTSSPSLVEPLGSSSIVNSQPPPPHPIPDGLQQSTSAPLISSPNVVNNPIAVPCSSNSSSSSNSGGVLPSTSNNNNSIVPNLKRELTPGSMPNEIENGENLNAKDDDEDDEDSNDENDFDMLDETKGGMYTGDGEEGDMSGQPEDTGEIFPDDPNVNFNLGDLPGDIGDGDGTGLENQSEEEDSEEDSDNDDGECNEFTYQSDASYSQEGMGEPGSVNPNGDGSLPGPSGVGLNKDLLALEGGPGTSGGELVKASGSGGSGRNRLSRSLWPPGIPYHGPQQCPYCPRILSNVGNWRKHVLTMHFAREKVHKCIHCASSFRTPEYLQKHYVRVHNYPQKMTRRKYVEQTMKGETH